MQTVCWLENSTNHTELALKKIYAGMEQRSTETLSTYLERVQQTGEDAFGLSSNWSNKNATQVLGVVINGVRNKQLSSLIATYIITLPVNFAVMKTHFVQYEAQVQMMPKAAEINEFGARNEIRLHHLAES